MTFMSTCGDTLYAGHTALQHGSDQICGSNSTQVRMKKCVTNIHILPFFIHSLSFFLKDIVILALLLLAVFHHGVVMPSTAFGLISTSCFSPMIRHAYCRVGTRPKFHNSLVEKADFISSDSSYRKRWSIVRSSSNSNAEVEGKKTPHGLLFSSFTEGVRPSKEVARFIKKIILPVMVSEFLLKQQQQQPSQKPVEQPTATSLYLNQLLEQLMNETQKVTSDEEELVLPLRLLYIPTAMYALRKDSLNTPGKQRQRARADAKSRRDAIVQYLQNVFIHDAQNATTNSQPITVDVSALTLDIEDGSLKHPFSSLNAYPSSMNGEAITISKNNININITSFLHTYSPHIIYVDGGNTFWLHHCLSRNNNYYWNALVNFCSNAQHNCRNCEHNSINPLPLTKSVLYCGQSAGAIVAGSYVETATWKGWDDPSIVPGMEDPQSWKGVRGMDLFGNNISIFPHYSEEWKELVQSRNQTSFITNNGTTSRTRLVCLSNSEVLAITGGRCENVSYPQNMQIFSTANESFPTASFAPQ